MDKLIGFQNAIKEAKLELDELNECGDLEDRLLAAQYLAELEAEFLRETLRETGGL